MTRLTEKMYAYPAVKTDDWKRLTGPVPVRLTNDYLFRALMQSDEGVLKAVVAAVLGRKPGEISSVEIRNPVLLGDALGRKGFVLDLQVLVDGREVVNMEMQVCKYEGWNDRFLGYLCRSFDHLNRGQSYRETRPVLQVAFLDFVPFEGEPEFFATYKMRNVKTGRVYT
ncbi:MAG: PD-(D/E)XK nuclease family transposase, partial [Lachnospiraceae bacterium]|nr:PD-(D/E)XK nuclease family transposase [Lachnospiraceae bacterium]